jgi:hypothetical protein
MVKLAPDYKRFYPTLRRVDIAPSGVFALRMFGN